MTDCISMHDGTLSWVLAELHYIGQLCKREWRNEHVCTPFLSERAYLSRQQTQDNYLIFWRSDTKKYVAPSLNPCELILKLETYHAANWFLCIVIVERPISCFSVVGWNT